MDLKEFKDGFGEEIVRRPFWKIRMKSYSESFNSKSIYGIPLLVDDDLLMVCRVWEFVIDGYIIINIADIDNILNGEVEVFVSNVLKNEGVINKKLAPPINDIENFYNIFNQLSSREINIGVQCKNKTGVKYGKIINVEGDYVDIKEFDGIGIWYNEMSKVMYNQIQEITICTRYIDIMSKYVMN